MKSIRRIGFPVSVLALVTCVTLLLNVTAPNPTGRRYSSQMPLVTGQGSAEAIGQSGEEILARDLRLPNNNATDQRQCLCRSVTSPNPIDCNVCIPVSSLTSTFRIPDFIAAGYIAESKNAQNLLYNGREVDQINDYVLAAKELKRPLWLFIRVDTLVAPEFEQIVESTGGDVVHYFTVPGYADSVDDMARKGVAVSLVMIGGLSLLQWRARKPLAEPVSPPKPASSARPSDPVNKTKRKVETAEEFARRTRERTQSNIDEQDAWNDL